MLIMAMAIGLVACHDEKIDLTGKDDCGDKEVVGYISFSGEGLSVNVDNEAAAGEIAPESTRAGVVALEDYTVEIWNEVGEMVKSFAYGAREEQYAQGEDGIAVPVGNYTVKAYSRKPEKASTTPEYAGQTTVSVEKNKTTEASITCKLSSVKVSVRFDPILASLINEEAQSRVALGKDDLSEYTFTGRPVTPKVADSAVTDGLQKMAWDAEGGFVYLRPNEEVNPLVVYLTAVYNGSNINNQALKVCDDAKPGEWRQVTVKLDKGDSGTVYIIIEVQTWVEGEEIDVDVTEIAMNWGESSIPDDSDAPEIKWINHDLTQMFTITDAMFNTAGEFVEGAAFEVKTKSAMAAFKLGVSTTNSDLQEAIVSMGLTVDGGANISELANTSKMILGGWGFPTKSVTELTELTFDLSALMKDLHANYAGTHKFTITVADAKGSSTTAELNITSGLVVDPNIQWVGQDIDKVVDIYPLDENDKTTMELLVTAKTGIKSLIVSVEGVLAPALPSVGLPTSFDLVNPVDDSGKDISATLSGLGFKVGEQVKDQTSVSFDITGFKALLKVAPGVTKFKVDLTDNEGNNIVKSMQLNIVVPEE